MEKTYIVAEEYIDEQGTVYDSTILLDSDDEQYANGYAEKHVINDERKTQVAVWEMENDTLTDSNIIKKNF